MKIDYIWISQYRGIENKGFNFSSRDRYEFDEKTGVLKHYYEKETKSNEIIEMYKDGPKNTAPFFSVGELGSSSNIDDIIAIVGNNGAGKTSILELIMDLNNLENKKNIKYIIVLNDYTDEIKIIKNFKNFKSPESEFYTYKDDESIDILKKFKVIFHSNSFDYNMYKKDYNASIVDISTSGLLKSDFDNYLYEENKDDDGSFDRNNIFFKKEFDRQIYYISKFESMNKYKLFNIPNKLNIFIEPLVDLKDDILYFFEDIDDIKDYKKSSKSKLQFYNLFYEFNKSYDKFKDKLRYEKDYNQLFISVLLQNLIYEMVYSEIMSSSSKIDAIKNKEDEINYFISFFEGNTQCVDISKIIKNFTIEFRHYGSAYNIFSEKYYKYFKKLDELLETEQLKQLNFDEELDRYILDVTSSDVIKELILQLNYFAFNKNYISFSWNLSSGEYYFLSLFSRLYSISEQFEYPEFWGEDKDRDINDIEKSCTILLDEADLYYHPEWQQKYIKILIEFLNELYKDIKFQIILTTHSPIVLSDIPGDNIIYLKKKDNNMYVEDKKIKTFGSNIYNLYNNSFYLNSSEILGVIGEFATSKIKETMNSLDEKIKEIKDIKQEDIHEEEEELKSLIENSKIVEDLIGEEFIKDLINDKIKYIKSILEEVKGSKNEIESFYDKLSISEKKQLINYILNSDNN